MKSGNLEGMSSWFRWQPVLYTTILVLGIAALTGSARAELPGRTNKGQANISTAEARIAFWGNLNDPSNSDIYTMDPNGSNVSRLTTDPGVDYSPSWSPDGQKIVFVSNRSGDYEIYVMDANGANQHIIPTGLTQPDQPVWSPDGTRIAFQAYPPGESVSQIYVMHSNGGSLTPLTTVPVGAKWPTWSPDSSMIAFTEVMDKNKITSIVVMNDDGSNPHAISTGSIDAWPAWSPDGVSIAFARLDTNLEANIWTMNVDGTGQTQVTTGVTAFEPAWAPDSLQIAFTNSTQAGQQVFIVDVNGNNPHSISGGASPAWHGDSSVVLVQNAQGTPVPNAQVWRNSQGVGYPSTFVGTTNISGTLLLPGPILNEFLVARSLVYTGTTTKAAHDNWAYHVWATNIVQQADGLQSAYMITDTSSLTHTLVVTSTSPLIGFNIVASVEFNTTADNLATIAQGLSGKDRPNGLYYAGASDFLLDVTDGQMFFEKVTIYEDKQNWDGADFQFYANQNRAYADGLKILTSPWGHIHAQASGHFGTDPWSQLDAYSAFVHEFSHYAIGADDEYYYHQDGDNAACNLTPNADYDYAASIMTNQAVASEFCTLDNHNTQTHQQVTQGGSVWRTLQNNWTDSLSRWIILSPNNRGFFDPGPLAYISREAQYAVPAVVPVGVAACSPFMVTVLGITGSPIQTATLSLQHNGYVIDEGTTDINGQALLYGAVAGQDKVTAFDPGGIPLLRTASANITSCAPITLTLTTLLAADAPETAWPSHWLTATADYSQNQVNASLHFMADPPQQPLLYASQGGTNREQLPLTYDPAGHNYMGTYPLDPNVAADFQFDVGITGTNGLELFPYRFDASQFHSAGPSYPTDASGVSGSTGVTDVPSDWDLFGPESRTNLSVKPDSLPDGTGVMAGQVPLPALPPGGLFVVGGPISVQGENPISGTLRLSLSYQSESYCGLLPATIQIYHYNGTGWNSLTTLLNEDWHSAAADITQWGIYAVFAQPNPQATFSDVPAGSTFYDYINWITCHGIASGYSDGTFHPSNNASRGQISKMMALTYKWHLDPPSNAYTFADVLPGSTFFLYVEAAYREGVVSGYSCGDPGEPCGSDNRPYFRPSNNVTRGQIAKIISNGSRFSDPVAAQTFEDVVPGSTFYDYIGRMSARNIINGYPCGGPGEPCGVGNRPYFRPSSNATRGQLSKMIYLAASPR